MSMIDKILTRHVIYLYVIHSPKGETHPSIPCSIHQHVPLTIYTHFSNFVPPSGLESSCELLIASRRHSRNSLQSLRTYTATPPPPAGQPTPNPKAKQEDNTLMYTTLGLVAAAGAYYYFRNTDEAQELKDKTKADVDQLKRRNADLTDAAKARAEDVKQQGKSKLDQVKVCGLSSRFEILIH